MPRGSSSRCYRGHQAKPGYHCSGKVLVEGRGAYCLTVGGTRIDQAVAGAFLAALEPAKLVSPPWATLAAAEQLEVQRDEMLDAGGTAWSG